MKKSISLVLMVVFLLGTSLFAQESVIEKIQKDGVIRVGMSTFVPWAMKDKQGNLIGFEIDVAKKLDAVALFLEWHREIVFV